MHLFSEYGIASCFLLALDEICTYYGCVDVQGSRDFCVSVGNKFQVSKSIKTEY